MAIDALDRATILRNRPFIIEIQQAMIGQSLGSNGMLGRRQLLDRPRQQHIPLLQHHVEMRRARVAGGCFVMQNDEAGHESIIVQSSKLIECSADNPEP